MSLNFIFLSTCVEMFEIPYVKKSCIKYYFGFLKFSDCLRYFGTALVRILFLLYEFLLSFSSCLVFLWILCYSPECFPIQIPMDDPFFKPGGCMSFGRSMARQDCNGKMSDNIFLVSITFFSSVLTPRLLLCFFLI